MANFLAQLKEKEPTVFNALKAVSLLRPMSELSNVRGQAIIDATLFSLAVKFHGDVGGNFVIRDMMPQDGPALSTQVWGVEVSSGSVAYATTSAWDNTAIADNTYLALWGVKMATPASTESGASTYPTTLEPVVSAFKITLGQAVVALWNLYPIVHVMQPDMAESSVFIPQTGLAESPLIVTKEQIVHIQEYSSIATADQYNAWWLGATAEPVGRNLAPPA